MRRYQRIRRARVLTEFPKVAERSDLIVFAGVVLRPDFFKREDGSIRIKYRKVKIPEGHHPVALDNELYWVLDKQEVTS